MTRFGLVLKISVFATGCAGIVAEFVLSTLATYLIGNAVFQWTMVMSLMLFAMGVGSRLSKLLEQRLLESFIFIHFWFNISIASAWHPHCIGIRIRITSAFVSTIPALHLHLHPSNGS